MVTTKDRVNHGENNMQSTLSIKLLARQQIAKFLYRTGNNASTHNFYPFTRD